MPMKQRASENVFRDLGFAPEEAECLRIRSALMVALTQHIRRTGMTQKQAEHEGHSIAVKRTYGWKDRGI